MACPANGWCDSAAPRVKPRRTAQRVSGRGCSLRCEREARDRRPRQALALADGPGSDGPGIGMLRAFSRGPPGGPLVCARCTPPGRDAAGRRAAGSPCAYPHSGRSEQQGPPVTLARTAPDHAMLRAPAVSSTAASALPPRGWTQHGAARWTNDFDGAQMAHFELREPPGGADR